MIAQKLLDDKRGRSPLFRSVLLFAVCGSVLAGLSVGGLCADDSGSSAATAEQSQRVRELIYVLRQHRVFERVDEWASAIRELVTIGKPAVPELVAELDKTNRGFTLRALGFTLRAINDPRAVPGLIRAIPKTLRRGSSDCGTATTDPGLLEFMRQNDRSENDRSFFSYGRPVNEILDALTAITGHHEPPEAQRDPLRHVFLPDDETQPALRERRMFGERKTHWESWWSDHWQEFVTQEELDSVTLPARDEDLVEADGVARFGPLFPTGPDVELGPVIEVKLKTAEYWDGKSHIDLDTGYLYEYLEGADNNPHSGVQVQIWFQDKGIDVRHHSGLSGSDLHGWLIGNERWETIAAEVRSGQPLPLGREFNTHILAPFDADRGVYLDDQIGTFLFTTREGSRGIMQVGPKTKDQSSRRFRYRLWGNPNVGQPVATTIAPEGHRRTVPRARVTYKRVTLELPGRGKKFLLDLESGQPQSPPDEVVSPDLRPTSNIHKQKQLTEWFRGQGIEVVATRTSDPSEPQDENALIGFDMRTRQVSANSFLLFDVGDVREILARDRPKGFWYGWVTARRDSAGRRSTSAFETKSGRLGVLQIIKSTEDPLSITFRYRMFETVPHSP